MRRLYWVLITLISVVGYANATEIRAFTSSIQQGIVHHPRLGQTSPEVSYRVGLRVHELAIQPFAQFGLVANGQTEFDLRPRGSLGASVRLDIFELVPYVTTQVGVDADSSMQPFFALGCGLERIFRNGWFLFLESGLEFTVTDEAPPGRVFLLGIGLTHHLDELI